MNGFLVASLVTISRKATFPWKPRGNWQPKKVFHGVTFCVTMKLKSSEKLVTELVTTAEKGVIPWIPCWILSFSKWSISCVPSLRTLVRSISVALFCRLVTT